MKISHEELIQRRKRDREAVALQKIEGNPFTDEENEMFAMFDREGWSDQQCSEYIEKQEDALKAQALSDKRRA